MSSFVISRQQKRRKTRRMRRVYLKKYGFRMQQVYGGIAAGRNK